MLRWRCGAALFAALVACSNEVSITDGTCGNFVLDPGEDCDSPPIGSKAVCTATCRIACDPTQRGMAPGTCSSASAIDGTCCPSGFTCGVDKTCHAPAGLLQPNEIIQPFDMTAYVVADLNGDNFADVLGVSSGIVQARYGAAASQLASSVAVNAPFATGTFAIGDYKGNGHPEVLIPTAAGMFAFETDGGTPAQVAFPAEAVKSHTTRLRAAANPSATSAVAGVPNLVRLDFDDTALAVKMSANDGAAQTPAQPFTPCATTFASTQVAHGRALHPFADCPASGSCPLRTRVPITITDASGNLGACIDGPTAVAPSPQLFTFPAATMLPPAPASAVTPAVDGETLFARLAGPSGTACPDLVMPGFAIVAGVRSETAIVVPATTGAIAGACTVDSTRAFYAQTGGAPAQPIGIPLAVAVVANGASRATGIVTSTGVYTINTTTQLATRVSSAPRVWRFATVADLDGDGLDDIVTTGTAEDVEVLLQVANPTQTQWRDVRIPTSATIYEVQIGDYDGDNLADVAMVQIDPTTNIGTVTIAFAAAPDAFGTPITTAAVPEFAYILGTPVVDPALPAGFDQSDDLVVGYGGFPNNPQSTDRSRLVILYGSPDRNLTAPWVSPTSASTAVCSGAAAPAACPTGWAAAIGHFNTNGTAVAYGIFTTTGGTSNHGEVIPMQRNSDTFLAPSVGSIGAAQELAGCPLNGAKFCPANGRFVAWPRHNGDILLALRGDHAIDQTGATLPNADCGGFFVPSTNANPLDPVTFTTASCASFIDQATAQSALGASYAQYAFGIASVRVIAASDTSLTLIAPRADATLSPRAAAIVWTVSLSSATNTPVLASPIDLSVEVQAFENATLGAPTPSPVTCSDAAPMELGQRVIGTTTYGEGLPDLVVACHVPNPAKTTMQLLGRWSDPGGGPPHYEIFHDFGKDLAASMRVGDFNGDGIDDVVFTTGTQGQGEIHLRLQCDTHDASCKTGGP